MGNFIIIPVPDFHLHETGLLYGHSTFPAASDLSERCGAYLSVPKLLRAGRWILAGDICRLDVTAGESGGGLATLAGSGGSSDSGGSRGILERDSTDLPVFGADRDKMAPYRYRLRYDSGGASHRPGQVGKNWQPGGAV